MLNQYKELLALTQIYLFQEFSLDKRIYSEKNTVDHFRELALKQQQKQKPLPLQPILAAPPPVSIYQQKPVSPTPKMPPVPISKAIEEIPVPKALPEKPSSFELQPIDSKAKSQVEHFKNSVQKYAPNLSIKDSIPEVSIPKQSKKPPAVVILYSSSAESYLPFLNNIAKAAEAISASTDVLQADWMEQNDQWEIMLKSPHLKLIIIASLNLKNFPKLMHHYKESDSQQFFNSTPLLKIPDISLYPENPKLKSVLWNTIKSAVQ